MIDMEQPREPWWQTWRMGLVVTVALLGLIVAAWWLDPDRRAYAACVDKPDFGGCTYRLDGKPQERRPEDWHRDPCWSYDSERNPLEPLWWKLGCPGPGPR